MKTQVNKFEAERQLTNKVMFIFLLVVGTILLFVLVKNIYNEVSSNTHSSYEILNPNKGFSGIGYVLVKKTSDISKTEDAGYITPIKPCCAQQVKAGLEIKKMKNYMNSNKNVLLQQTLEALADVEEPEFLIEEVFRMFETQKDQLEEALEVEEWMTNEESWNINTIMNVPASVLEVESESTLNVENWMTDDNTWIVYNYEALSAFATEIVHEETLDLEPWMFIMDAPEEKKEVETGIELLDPIVTSKNMEILREINFIKNLSEFLTEQNEEQLKIEGWMKDSKYWSVKELVNY